MEELTTGIYTFLILGEIDMETYTDLPQSKKLAEILSNETSDMYYWCGESIRFGGYKAQR